MILIPGLMASGQQGSANMLVHPAPPPQPFGMPGGGMVQPAAGQKRSYLDIATDALQHPILSTLGDDAMHAAGGATGQRKKGRKKSFIWAHAVTDESGKVHCKHCNALIRVNYGEKVERLRRHFVKSCSKNPFPKDSKEYEELVESVNAPHSEGKKKSYVSANKGKSNRVISYSVGFVATVLSGPCCDLTKEQIHRLEAQGNRSSNWSAVKFTDSPSVSFDSSLERIVGCSFNGRIFIGMFTKNTTLSHNLAVPSGLYNSNFSGTCVLSDNCYVHNCSVVSNVFIGRNSALVQCGQVFCEGNTSYGTQRVICLGSESAPPSAGQSRSVSLNITSTYHDICSSVLALKRPHEALHDAVDPDWLPGKMRNKAQRSNKNDDYIRFDMSIICDDAEIVQCSYVRNMFVGSYSKVEGSMVDSCTLLSHCSITASECSDVVMHESCHISARSFCKGALLFSQSGVEGAKLEECVLGPDAHVANGEVKRSLLGPFVGYHHQGLLISTCWPLGRGNLAYGAMVGANHTGRTNDQECLLGEGCFFGLASSVKFPFNMLFSPYSLIAANTQCHPQKICFPFSLVSNCEASDGRGFSSRNMLRPAWVLWSSPYFVERAAIKFSKRRKSVDYRTDFPVFRPSIVDMVLDARNRLLKLKHMQVLPVQDEPTVLNLDEQHLYGIGRCLLPSTDIDRAIDAYTNFIRRYALHGLLFLIATADSCSHDLDTQPTYETVDPDSLGTMTIAIGTGLDSDSEDEDSNMGMMMHAPPQASKPPPPPALSPMQLQQQQQQQQHLAHHPPAQSSAPTQAQLSQQQQLQRSAGASLTGMASTMPAMTPAMGNVSGSFNPNMGLSLSSEGGSMLASMPLLLQQQVQTSASSQVPKLPSPSAQPSSTSSQASQGLPSHVLHAPHLSQSSSSSVPSTASGTPITQMASAATSQPPQQQQQQQQASSLLQNAASGTAVGVAGHSSASLPSFSASNQAGLISALLEDVRRMEAFSPRTIEEYLIMVEQRRGGLTENVIASNKRAVIDFANNGLGNVVMKALIARTGSCCLLTDSHIYAVRSHQLRVLVEEFPGIDFVSILDACPRGGVLGQSQSIPSMQFDELRQLLQLAVDLERHNLENIRGGRRKDMLRAADVITGSPVDVNAAVEEDETVQKARARLDDIALCVQHLLTQLHG